MELPFELWDKIYEKCGTFKSRRKLYQALPASYRAQYQKKFIIDGDKSFLKFLQIYDGINVIFSISLGYPKDNFFSIICKIMP